MKNFSNFVTDKSSSICRSVHVLCLNRQTLFNWFIANIVFIKTN
jgi:hypothetical protein